MNYVDDLVPACHGLLLSAVVICYTFYFLKIEYVEYVEYVECVEYVE